MLLLTVNSVPKLLGLADGGVEARHNSRTSHKEDTLEEEETCIAFLTLPNSAWS
jgi:hypothetical protein